jgi:hypothetical protein
MPVIMQRTILFALVAALFTGCATTPRINWQARVGVYTFDQAVKELGPPDKSAKLSDGSTVAEWLTRRGYYYPTAHYYPFVTRGYGPPYPITYAKQRVPDEFLRLTFGPDGKLAAWRKFSR